MNLNRHLPLRLMALLSGAWLLSASVTPLPAFGQSPETRPDRTSEVDTLWGLGRESAAAGKWDVAVDSFHRLLAILQNPAGEAWKSVPAATPTPAGEQPSAPGLGEATRKAIRALPPEARAIARERFDPIVRREADAALETGEVVSMLRLIREYPVSDCLPDLYRRLGRDAVEARRWTRARAWFERLRSEFPEAFIATAEAPAGLALAYARLHEPECLEALTRQIESSASALQAAGPTPDSPIPLSDYCRSLAPASARPETRPYSWRPGDCAPAIGVIGGRVWSRQVPAGSEILARRFFPGNVDRPGDVPLFPYQPILEEEACWVHLGSTLSRLSVGSGDIEFTRRESSALRIEQINSVTPDTRCGAAMAALTPSWAAGFIGLPLVQRGHLRIDGSGTRAARLVWIDRTSDEVTVVDGAAEGPLKGTAPSTVPAIATDLPVFWLFRPQSSPEGGESRHWSATLASIEPTNPARLHWEAGLITLDAGMASSRDRGPFERHALLAAEGARVYACDQAGQVVCVDALTGALHWAFPYTPRPGLIGDNARRPALGWAVNPILIVEDRVVVTPLNSDEIYVLAAETGARKWKARREKSRYLLGVRNGLVYFSGDTLFAMELQTGRLKFDPKIPLVRQDRAGRGLVAEDGIYLPIDSGLVVLDPATGAWKDTYAWRPASGAPPIVGNLAASATHLIVAGEGEIDGFRTNVHPIPPEALAATFERLFAELRSDRFAAREAASMELIDIGAPAIPILERARSDPDPEVAWRAHKLLDVVRDAQTLVRAAATPPPVPDPVPPPR